MDSVVLKNNFEIGVDEDGKHNPGDVASMMLAICKQAGFKPYTVVHAAAILCGWIIGSQSKSTNTCEESLSMLISTMREVCSETLRERVEARRDS